MEIITICLLQNILACRRFIIVNFVVIESKYFPYTIGYWQYKAKPCKKQSLFSIRKRKEWCGDKVFEWYYMFTRNDNIIT